MMCEKDVETRKDNKRTNNEDSQINELSNKNNSGTVEVNNANNVVEHNVCFTRDEENIETENQLIHNSFIEGCNVKTIADTTCKEETMNEASLRDSIEEIRTTQDNKRESGSKHGAVTVFVRHVGEDVKKNETDNVKEYKQEEFKSEKLQDESENVLVSMEDLSNCNKSLDNDINDIEMVMMKKERELYRPAVRTIFNNPKISRVTSNCCILI
ncbi:putative uncharacterized protein DDB_G0293878 [Xenia sp. Carnegie-2017]|uniref:putative uncharacterized protein DDB_G0293878 n=1 Tax=Xenia sp. Carnegie-2017 TaxID=2897299 RepID=UPI001F034EA8|nr:putative uncharacterized protein DDB_G0293878 [Xenia sp. Carnegie-2017]